MTSSATVYHFNILTLDFVTLFAVTSNINSADQTKTGWEVQ